MVDMKLNRQNVKIAPGNSLTNFPYHHPRPTVQFKIGKVMLPSKPWKARLVTSFFFSVPTIILSTGITYFSIIIIVIKIIVIEHMMQISPTKCANSADYYFRYFFSFCPKNPSEHLYVDPPTMLSSCFLIKENASASWISDDIENCLSPSA